MPKWEIRIEVRKVPLKHFAKPRIMPHLKVARFLPKPNTQLRVNSFAAFAAIKDRHPAESRLAPIPWNDGIIPKSPRGE